MASQYCDEKAKLEEEVRHELAGQRLELILHSHGCRLGVGMCGWAHCGTMKTVLSHLALCERAPHCTVIHCDSSRQLIVHWKNCRSQYCTFCEKLLSSSRYKEAAIPPMSFRNEILADSKEVYFLDNFVIQPLSGQKRMKTTNSKHHAIKYGEKSEADNQKNPDTGNEHFPSRTTAVSTDSNQGGDKEEPSSFHRPDNGEDIDYTVSMYSPISPAEQYPMCSPTYSPHRVPSPNEFYNHNENLLPKSDKEKDNNVQSSRNSMKDSQYQSNILPMDPTSPSLDSDTFDQYFPHKACSTKRVHRQLEDETKAEVPAKMRKAPANELSMDNASLIASQPGTSSSHFHNFCPPGVIPVPFCSKGWHQTFSFHQRKDSIRKMLRHCYSQWDEGFLPSDAKRQEIAALVKEVEFDMFRCSETQEEYLQELSKTLSGNSLKLAKETSGSSEPPQLVPDGCDKGDEVIEIESNEIPVIDLTSDSPSPSPADNDLVIIYSPSPVASPDTPVPISTPPLSITSQVTSAAASLSTPHVTSPNSPGTSAFPLGTSAIPPGTSANPPSTSANPPGTSAIPSGTLNTSVISQDTSTISKETSGILQSTPASTQNSAVRTEGNLAHTQDISLRVWDTSASTHDTVIPQLSPLPLPQIGPMDLYDVLRASVSPIPSGSKSDAPSHTLTTQQLDNKFLPPVIPNLPGITPLTPASSSIWGTALPSPIQPTLNMPDLTGVDQPLDFSRYKSQTANPINHCNHFNRDMPNVFDSQLDAPVDLSISGAHTGYVPYRPWQGQLLQVESPLPQFDVPPMTEVDNNRLAVQANVAAMNSSLPFSQAEAKPRESVGLPQTSTSVRSDDSGTPDTASYVFECIICFDTLSQIKANNQRLMSTICGHLFCEPCIKSVLKKDKKCPSCRKKLTKNKIHPIFL